VLRLAAWRHTLTVAPSRRVPVTAIASPTEPAQCETLKLTCTGKFASCCAHSAESPEAQCAPGIRLVMGWTNYRSSAFAAESIVRVSLMPRSWAGFSSRRLEVKPAQSQGESPAFPCRAPASHHGYRRRSPRPGPSAMAGIRAVASRRD
jgi:hypothetical protein